MAAVDEKGNQTMEDVWSKEILEEDDATYVSIMTNISCSCDNNATIAIDDTGKLWIYGCNYYDKKIIDNIYGLNVIDSDDELSMLSLECGATIPLDKEGIIWVIVMQQIS